MGIIRFNCNEGMVSADNVDLKGLDNYGTLFEEIRKMDDSEEKKVRLYDLYTKYERDSDIDYLAKNCIENTGTYGLEIIGKIIRLEQMIFSEMPDKFRINHTHYAKISSEVYEKACFDLMEDFS